MGEFTQPRARSFVQSYTWTLISTFAVSAARLDGGLAVPVHRFAHLALCHHRLVEISFDSTRGDIPGNA